MTRKQSDTVRVLAIPAAVMAVFAIVGEIGLGLILWMGLTCFMADEFSHKYNNK